MRVLRFVPIMMLTLASVAGAQQSVRKSHETEADLQREAKMSMAAARAMAKREVPGATIASGEIEREGGKLIYSFDMKTAGKSGIDEVNIDAMTGKLVSKAHESPKDEKAEAKADAKAAKKSARP